MWYEVDTAIAGRDSSRAACFSSITGVAVHNPRHAIEARISPPNHNVFLPPISGTFFTSNSQADAIKLAGVAPSDKVLCGDIYAARAHTSTNLKTLLSLDQNTAVEPRYAVQKPSQ